PGILPSAPSSDTMSIAAHFSVSALWTAYSASGVCVSLATISWPMSVSRLRTVASASAAATAALSLFTTSCGVPVGTHKPCQNEMLTPGTPSSSLVATSGAANQRVLANTAYVLIWWLST